MAEKVVIKEGVDTLVTVGVIGLGGWLAYKYLIRPAITEPIQTKHYAQRLQVTRPTIRIQLDKKRILVNMRVNNPNQNPLFLNSVVAQLWAAPSDPKVMALHLGDVDYFTKTVIKPNDFTTLEFSIDLKTINAISMAAQILAGKWVGYQFELRGNINANNRPWPIKEQLNLV